MAVAGCYQLENHLQGIIFCDRFIDFEYLFELVRRMRSLKFSVKSERDGIIQELQYPMRVTITKTNRFPDGKILVSLDRGLVSSLLDQIVRALDLRERPGDDRSRFNDQKVAFTKSVEKIKSTMTNAAVEKDVSSGIYSRDSFEQAFNLTWVPSP